MNCKIYPLLLTFLVAIGFAHSTQALCSVSVSDTLLPNFDLQLTATPTSGVAPFTFTWTISGSLAGNSITPAHTSIAGDTVVISSNDLFTNYGCLFITLCMQDSTGCNTCIMDTANTTAIVCYSAFGWMETQPGEMMITLNNPVPQFMGFTVVTWTDSIGNQSTMLQGGMAMFHYTPAVYNANGYDVPVCVQTFFNNVSYMCIACDTVHVSAIAPSGVTEAQASFFRVINNPVHDELVLQLNEESHTASASVQLLDINGRLIHTETVREHTLSLSTRTLPKGVYVLKVSDGSRVQTSKILKE
jgi:hypothetical protein